MNWKTVSLGLGLFSIALGAAEILAPRKITRALDAEGHERLVRGFGLRAVVAGAGVIAQPAVATGVWSRVVGDALDLGALGFAAKESPRNPAVWGVIAFVVGATVLDVLTARGLDTQTGKTSPVREPAMA